MDEFPFTKDEWVIVQSATHEVLNATLADDQVLRQSKMIELEAVLNGLRTRYGDHPVLIETFADFQESPTMQLDLYRSALELAERNNLPTFTIRISLARLLLEDFDEAKAAARELLACQRELANRADQGDLAEWSELLSTCSRRKRN